MCEIDVCAQLKIIFFQFQIASSLGRYGSEAGFALPAILGRREEVEERKSVSFVAIFYFLTYFFRCYIIHFVLLLCILTPVLIRDIESRDRDDDIPA